MHSYVPHEGTDNILSVDLVQMECAAKLVAHIHLSRGIVARLGFPSRAGPPSAGLSDFLRACGLSRPRDSNPEPVVYKTTALPIELGRREFPRDSRIVAANSKRNTER